jgi:hypothetical protein
MVKKLNVTIGLLLCASLGLLQFACSSSSPSDSTDYEQFGKLDDLYDNGEGCLPYYSPLQSGDLSADSVTEISGLIVSHKNPGVLWAINDKGGDNIMIAFDKTGRHLGDLKLRGAKNRDWEDISLGPGPEVGSEFIYIADIGDKDRERDEIVVYRVEEPDWSTLEKRSSEPIDWDYVESLHFVYPDGLKHNAKAFLVDPLFNYFYIITRRSLEDNVALIYRAPIVEPTEEPIELEKVFEDKDGFFLPWWISGASISSDGLRILIIGKHEAPYEWLRKEEELVEEAVFEIPCMNTDITYEKVEALDYDRADEGFFLVSNIDVFPIIYVGLDLGYLGLDQSLECKEFLDPTTLGQVSNDLAREISGVTASQINPGTLWAHNDHGAANTLFAFQDDGSYLAEFVLDGAVNIDWEDIAIGPKEDQANYLHIADIGDNEENRTHISIYRVPEPVIDPDQAPYSTQLESVEELVFTYGDQRAHDAESLMIDPLDGALYIITKSAKAKDVSLVFEARPPFVEGVTHELNLVVSEVEMGISLGRIVGSDISKDGTSIIIMYKDAEYNLMWSRDPAEPLWRTILHKPCLTPTVGGQIEAIGFAPDFSGYYMVPEGVQPNVYFVQFAD